MVQETTCYSDEGKNAERNVDRELEEELTEHQGEMEGEVDMVKNSFKVDGEQFAIGCISFDEK